MVDFNECSHDLMIIEFVFKKYNIKQLVVERAICLLSTKTKGLYLHIWIDEKLDT